MELTIIVLDFRDDEPDSQGVTHSHKCGFMGWRGDQDGCGFVVKHTNLCAGSNDAHMCPACGRGPWRVIFVPTEEAQNGPTES